MPKEIALDTLDLAEFVKPGDTVTWGQACAEPLCLTERLVEQRSAIGHCNVMVGLSLSETLLPEHRDCFSVVSYGAIGTNSRLAARGALQVLPCNYSAIPRLLASGRLPVDVVLVQVSPRGPDGHHSLGLANDFLIPAMQAARVVIAEVNDRIPCSTLDHPLDDALLDVVVHCSREPVYAPRGGIGDVEKTIAGHVCELIPDGAVLQYGIGSLPSAILASLSRHRGLGIYSGMLTDDIIPLIESGVVTNETNRVRPGVSVGALAMGSESLNRYLHRNPLVELHPATNTHDITKLAQLDRLVALNSALEVDLFGQANAEVVNGRYVGAVGGQVDFMHAASCHANGLSVIALPSVTRSGKHSRIVARLGNSLVTTCKSDIDVIVTEHGVADLRGKTLAQRARAMGYIADPAFREQLQRSAHDLDFSAG